MVTVVGSAGAAVAATYIPMSLLTLMQVVLALLALMGSTLLIEQMFTQRETNVRLELLDQRISTALSSIPSGPESTLDGMLTTRQHLLPLEDRLRGAHRVSISGGSLARLANEYKGLFDELAEDGCGLRFLLTAPDSEAALILGRAVSYEYSAEGYVIQVAESLKTLAEVRDAHPSKCEVKTCTAPPPFSVLWAEFGDIERDFMQVEIYTLATPTRKRPTLAIKRSRDPRLYSQFSAQFELLWGETWSADPLAVSITAAPPTKNTGIGQPKS